MNVLLIGLGRWGEKHLRVLRQLGVTLWVADVSPARLEWAVRNGVESARAVRDYRAALAHVGAADIATPADTHWTVAALFRRKAARAHAGGRPRVAQAGAQRGTSRSGGAHLPVPPGDHDLTRGAAG